MACARRRCALLGGAALLALGCGGVVQHSGDASPPRPRDLREGEGADAMETGPDDGGPTPGDARGRVDGPRTDGAPAPPCGDGVADRTLDPRNGWYLEECDEGASNGKGASSCGADCRYRACSSGRPCGPLRSTFGAYLPWDDAGMAALLLSMKEQGYRELIPVNIGAQRWTKSGGAFTVTGVEDAYYRQSAGGSLLQRQVQLAEQAGIQVIVGLAGVIVDGGYDWEIWLSPARRAPFVEHSLDLAAEVLKQVGSSSAFRGFYLPGEMNLGQSLCEEAGGFYAQLIGGAAGRPGLRALLTSRGGGVISIAPYLAVAGQSPATIGTRLRCVFDKATAAGGLDRVMVQDGVPKAAEGFTTLATVQSYFQAMWSALPATSREALWVDLETYAWPDAPCTSAPGGSRPASIDRIGDQVRELGRYVGGFSQWIHAHNFRANGFGTDTCDGARAALGQAYVTRPFPFHGFTYAGKIILRGYRLLPAGALEVRCPTTSGTQTLSVKPGAGLGVHYAPSWVVDADVPDPQEIYEVEAPIPAACTGTMQVTFINPGGERSSVVPVPH